MNFLFHNRLLSTLMSVVGVGKDLHGVRLTKYRPHVACTHFWTDPCQKVILLKETPGIESSVLALLLLDSSTVTNTQKQVL